MITNILITFNRNEVIKEIYNIDNGIGTPGLELTFYLFLAWVFIYIVIVRGVKSSGKFAYFLALFPYFVMIILLIRACTLDGAFKGIFYFINPQFEKLLDPQVRLCTSQLILRLFGHTYTLNFPNKTHTLDVKN